MGKAQRKRWYEQNPVVSDALEAWEKFPTLLQVAIARHINELFRTEELVTRYRGLWLLAPFHIVHVYKTRRFRRRWYDRNETLRNTVNRLALTEHEDLVQIAWCIVMIRCYIWGKSIDPTALKEDELDQMVKLVFEKPHFIL